MFRIDSFESNEAGEARVKEKHLRVSMYWEGEGSSKFGLSPLSFLLCHGVIACGRLTSACFKRHFNRNTG